MATLIGQFDWATTPLGDMETWSPLLRSYVDLILSSPQPSLLAWGDALTMIYNDATVPAIGDKHPAALGHSYREVFSEAWPLIGPETDGCLYDGKKFMYEDVLIPLALQGGQTEDRYYTYSMIPVYEQDRIMGVYSIFQDTTEAVVAGRQLDRSTASMRTILEATTDGMVLVDRAWNMVFLNPAGQQMVAAVPDIVGRNLWEVFPSAKYENSPFLYHYHRAMDQGLAGEFVSEYPEPLNVTLQLYVRPVPDGILIVYRDITEQKRAATALIETEKLAAVGKLAASIAHEINNPLESVTNLLYLARRNGDADEIHGYLDTAERELRRVSVISSQTLRFHKQSSAPSEVTCSELFESVLSIYHGRTLNAHISVEKRKRSERPIACFEGEIRQVLNNLVGNAIDAMPQDGGRLLLRSREACDWRTGKKGIALTVADTGTGMPPAVLRKMFDAFYTTKGIGGTGLGLWVSKEIVDRHHGTLLVRSSQKEGHSGTVFTLFLPYDAVRR